MTVTLTHKDATQTFESPHGPAFRAARALVGDNPIDEGEGLVTSRHQFVEDEDEPETLHFDGCSFEELFPHICEYCESIIPNIEFDTDALLFLCPSCKKQLSRKSTG
jgi:hypothetical protein